MVTGLQRADELLRGAAMQPLVAEKQYVGGGHEVPVVAIVRVAQHMHIGGDGQTGGLYGGQQGAVVVVV